MYCRLVLYVCLKFEILSFWNLSWVHVCGLTDLQLSQPAVQQQQGETTSAEDAFVDKETVAKLTEGLLAHYLPDLQQSKGTLHELTWVLHGAQPSYSD